MPSVLTDIPSNGAARYPAARTALAYYPDETSEPVLTTWTEFNDASRAMANALCDAGLQPGDRLAMLTANSVAMLVTDFGAYANGIVTTSIYATSSPDEVRFILRDSGAHAILVGDAQKLSMVRAVAADCPELRLVIAVEADDDATAAIAGAPQVTSVTFDEFLARGRRVAPETAAVVAERTRDVNPDTLATLIYTSGTTGAPKGAMLTHGNFEAALRIHHERLEMLSDRDTSLCFLPLSHIFEKAWTYLCLDYGMMVSVNADPKAITKVIRRVRPTCMCSVPRFWEKVYTAVMVKMESVGPVKRLMIRRALKAGSMRNLKYVRTGRRVPALLEKRYNFYNSLVFKPILRAAGIENGNLFPTAGAPVSPKIVEFFRAIGVPMMVGYGLSETTATVTCFPTVDYEIGTVGTPIPGVEVRTGKDNEILVKGPTVMKGYFHNEKETREAFTEDGWFRTGDAGALDAAGDLTLTERLKDLFKTSNGKYIAPQMLETQLAQDKYIEQVAIIGDCRKYVTAIIIPAFKALREYARQKKIAFVTNADLIRNIDIRRLIQEHIDKIQQNLASYEKVKRFILLPHEFTVESGELTNTLKLRRPVINRRYASEIESMYS